MVARALVSVVNDDESVRESLPDLLRELAFRARAFASAAEFLASACIAETRRLSERSAICNGARHHRFDGRARAKDGLRPTTV